MSSSRSLPPIPDSDLAHVLAHTRDLWREAQGRSFFITGGTGFFGMWLLESFVHANEQLALGMRATVLTRDASAFEAKAPHLVRRGDLAFVEGDIQSFQFPAGEFYYVIHAATEASAKLIEEAPEEMLDTIVVGTRRALDFCSRANTRKFLLASSGAVYGIQPRETTHIPEDYLGAPDPLLSQSAYGIGKKIAEHMAVVRGKKAGFDVKIARCFAFVGPHLPLNTHFAIGNFIGDALAGRPIAVGGDGTPRRSYLYAADLAIWLWTLLFRGSSCRAYNVGSAESYSIAEIAATIDRVLGGKGVHIAKRPINGAFPAQYIPDIKSAATELKLSPLIPLEESLLRTYAWHKSLLA